MATIANTLLTGTSARVVSATTLGSTDTFTYLPGRGQVMTLRNATASAVTPNIDGAGGTTVPVAGLTPVNVADGLTLASIGAGVTVAIPLDTISAYLQGTIALTGGDGVIATLTSY